MGSGTAGVGGLLEILLGQEEFLRETARPLHVQLAQNHLDSRVEKATCLLTFTSKLYFPIT